MQYPRVGVNVVVYNPEGRVLLGKRKGGTGDSQWCLPGGKLDMLESLSDAALRETEEETGIRLGQLKLVTITNDPRPDIAEHWLHFTFEAETQDQPRLAEPDKFSEWGWFDLDRLPLPVFFGHEKLIEAYKKQEFLSD